MWSGVQDQSLVASALEEVAPLTIQFNDKDFKQILFSLNYPQHLLLILIVRNAKLDSMSPSLQRIIEVMGLSKGTVSRHARKLTELKLIIPKNRKQDGKLGGRPRRYYMPTALGRALYHYGCQEKHEPYATHLKTYR